MPNVARVIPLRQPETAEDLAREVLLAKRAIAEAEACLKALSPKLLAALEAEGVTGAAVPGLGAVTRYEAGPQMRLDTKAATAALQSAGLEIPLSPVGGGPQLRATLLK